MAEEEAVEEESFVPVAEEEEEEQMSFVDLEVVVVAAEGFVFAPHLSEFAEFEP